MFWMNVGDCYLGVNYLYEFIIESFGIRNFLFEYDLFHQLIDCCQWHVCNICSLFCCLCWRMLHSSTVCHMPLIWRKRYWMSSFWIHLALAPQASTHQACNGVWFFDSSFFVFSSCLLHLCVDMTPFLFNGCIQLGSKLIAELEPSLSFLYGDKRATMCWCFGDVGLMLIYLFLPSKSWKSCSWAVWPYAQPSHQCLSWFEWCMHWTHDSVIK